MPPAPPEPAPGVAGAGLASLRSCPSSGSVEWGGAREGPREGIGGDEPGLRIPSPPGTATLELRRLDPSGGDGASVSLHDLHAGTVTSPVDVGLFDCRDAGPEPGPLFARFRACVEGHPDLPFVVLCSDSGLEPARVLLAHGAVDIVPAKEAGSSALARALVYAVERKRLARRLLLARKREQRDATHDPVTGLPGRALFFSCLAQAARIAEHTRSGLAVLAIDIARLQSFNAVHGYSAGDRLIGILAERLQEVIRPSDVAGRLGGGTYLVLLREIGSGAAVEAPAVRILRELGRPIVFRGERFRPRARIGGALFPAHATTPEALVAAAERALAVARTEDIELSVLLERSSRSRPASA